MLSDLSLTPEFWLRAAGCLALAALALLGTAMPFRAFRGRPMPGRFSLLALRALALGALLLALTPPLREQVREIPRSFVVVADLSDSPTAEELQALQNHLAVRLADAPDCNVTLLACAADGQVRELHYPAGKLATELRADGWLESLRADAPEGDARQLHDFHGVLAYGQSLAALADAGELLALTDGRMTTVAAGGDTLPLRYFTAQRTLEATDVSLLRLRAPESLLPDVPLDWGILLRVPQDTDAKLRLQLLRDDAPIWDQAKDVTGTGAATWTDITTPALAAGDYELRATLSHHADIRPEDNLLSRRFHIAGPRPVVIVHGDPQAHANFAAAAEAAGSELEFLPVSELRGAPQKLSKYAFAVFSGVGPDDLSPDDWFRARAVVEHGGMGLCFIAGMEWEHASDPPLHPLNALLPVQLSDPLPPAPAENPVDLDRGPEPAPLPPDPGDTANELTPDEKGPIEQKVLTPSVAVILLIDRSGSMALDDRIEIAKASAIATAESMDENDVIGVCAFDVEPHWIFRPTKATNKAYITDSLRRLRPSGGTSLYPALLSSFEEMLRVDTNVKHVIVLSDGLTQDADFEKKLSEMTERKITVSAVFIGNEEGALRMARIAKWGKGNYYPATDLKEVPRIFTHDVKRRVEEYEARHPRKDPPPQKPPDRVETPVAAPRQPSPKDLLADTPLEGKPGETRESKAERIETFDLSLVTRGIDGSKLPAIHKWIPAAARPRMLTSLRTVDSHSPVLGEGQLGLGRTYFLATDTYRWGAQIAEWKDFPLLVHQMLEGGMKHAADEGVQVEDNLRREGNRLHLTWVTYGADGKPMPNADAVVTLRRKAEAAAQIPLRRIGPGAFAAVVDLPAGEEATVEVDHKQGDRFLTRRAYTALGEPDAETRSRYAPTQAGRVFPDAAGWKESGIPANAGALQPLRLLSAESADYLLLLFALCLFPLEVLLRRWTRSA